MHSPVRLSARKWMDDSGVSFLVNDTFTKSIGQTVSTSPAFYE